MGRYDCRGRRQKTAECVEGAGQEARDLGRDGERWGEMGRSSASRARGRLLIETRAVPARSMADVCRPYTREAPTRDLGRSGEIWGDLGRYTRGRRLHDADMGRYGEIWGDMGRYTRGRRLHDAMRGASAVLLRLGPAVHGGEAPRARSHQRSAVAEGEASRQSVRSAAAVQPAVSEACSPRRRTRRPMASDVKTTWVGGGGECASDPALPPRPLLEPLSEPLSNHSRC